MSKAAGVLFVWVAGAVMGPEAFGLLSLGLSITFLVQHLSDGGLSDALVKFLSGAGEPDADRLLGTAALLSILFAISGSLSLYLVAPTLAVEVFSDGELSAPLRVLAVGVLLWVPLTHLRAVLQARESVREIVRLALIEHVGKLVLLVLALFLIGGVEAAAAAVVVSFVLPLCVAGRDVVRLQLARAGGLPTRRAVGKTLRLAIPLLLVGFSYVLDRHADRLMLGALASSADVGVYTLASTVAGGALLLNTSLLAMFKPIVADAHREGHLSEASEAYRFVGKWAGIVSGGLLIALAAFGTQILSLAGESYGTGEAYAALLLIAGVYFFGTWIGPTGSVLQMCGGERLEIGNTLVSVALNIALNFWLIPLFGLVGAAMATATAVAVRNILQLVQLRMIYRFLPLETRHWVLLLCVTGLTLVIAATETGVRLDVLLCVTGLVGMAAYVRNGLSDVEREYLSAITAALRRR